MERDHIVFILGAGASVDAGAPLMNNFFDAARRVYLSGNLRESEKLAYEELFEGINRLQSVHSKASLDLHNLEVVFNAFEFSRLIGENEDGQGESTSDALKRVIVSVLDRSMQFTHANTRMNSTEDYVNLVASAISRKTNNADISFITFNYDLGLDLALHNVQGHLDYGFGDRLKDVVLLKLHGSMNWFTDQNRSLTHVIDISDVIKCWMKTYQGPFPETRPFPIQPGLVEFIPGHAGGEPIPFIVPPTWNKADQYRSITKIWREAAARLSQATTIIVIGYSLPETDAFFRLLYALGSRGNRPISRFIVINPSPEGKEVDQRFRSLMGTGTVGRYHYVPAPLSKVKIRLSGGPPQPIWGHPGEYEV